jgi:hypothetical protein
VYIISKYHKTPTINNQTLRKDVRCCKLIAQQNIMGLCKLHNKETFQINQGQTSYILVYLYPNEVNVLQRYDILTALTMQLTVIWDVMPCSLADT